MRSKKGSTLLIAFLVVIQSARGERPFRRIFSQVGEIVMLNWTFEGLRPIANFTNGDSLIGRSIKDGVHMTHSHRMGFKFPKKNLIAIQIDKVELEDAGVYLAKGIHIRHETYLLVVQAKPDKPIITSSVEDINILTFTCCVKLTSLPVSERRPINVTWYRNGTRLTEDEPGLFVNNDKLVVSRSYAAANQELPYECSVRETGVGLESDRSDPLFIQLDEGGGQSKLIIITVCTIIFILMAIVGALAVIKYRSRSTGQNWIVGRLGQKADRQREVKRPGSVAESGIPHADNVESLYESIKLEEMLIGSKLAPVYSNPCQPNGSRSPIPAKVKRKKNRNGRRLISRLSGNIGDEIHPERTPISDRHGSFKPFAPAFKCHGHGLDGATGSSPRFIRHEKNKKSDAGTTYNVSMTYITDNERYMSLDKRISLPDRKRNTPVSRTDSDIVISDNPMYN